MPKVKSPSHKPQWTVANIPTEMRDWEAARVFLEVSRCGSFRAAAQKLGQSVNAVRRTVEKFERDLGMQFLTRHVGGVQLTDEGAKIAQAARRMEEASFDLLLAHNASGTQAEGEVRLSVSEGLGTTWLLPRLLAFQRAHPGLVLNTQSGQPADLLRLEADLSVQFQRPTEPDLKVLKLGRLHMMIWASRGYIAKHGRPTSRADLRKHRFSVLTSAGISLEADYQRLLGDVVPLSSVLLRTNSTHSHFWAVASGAAIGSLPTYIAALGSDLVPLDGIEVPPHDIWLAYHPAGKRIPRVRTVLDWVVQAFDTRRAPWFRDEFIHPDRFAELCRGQFPVGHLVWPKPLPR